MVDKGAQLDIHGARFATWQRLAATAAAGTSTLTLQDPVNWTPGQLLVAATSIWRDEVVNQNEVRVLLPLCTVQDLQALRGARLAAGSC